MRETGSKRTQAIIERKKNSSKLSTSKFIVSRNLKTWKKSRIDVKFNNALKAKLCAYPENSRSLGEFERFEDDYYEFEIEEAMEEDSDPTGSALILARGKKKIDPIEKALKFKKGLDR